MKIYKWKTERTHDTKKGPKTYAWSYYSAALKRDEGEPLLDTSARWRLLAVKKNPPSESLEKLGVRRLDLMWCKGKTVAVFIEEEEKE